MVLILFLAMIGVPILEIVVFIQAGDLFGLWPTVAAVIVTAVIGSALLRYQGLATIARAQESLAAGELPMTQVFDGLCILVGGAFLLTPGFITDSVGFLLLVPAVRSILRGWARQYLATRGQVHTWSAGGANRPNEPETKHRATTTIIDGEFEEVPSDDENENTPSTGVKK
jgi:UPF0716 protein FxsA